MTLFPGSLLFFLSRKNRKENDEEGEETKRNDLLCRFVLDGTGRKIGESVSMDDDIIIIKSGNKYLGVPLKHIEDKGKTLLVKGLVDFGKAEEMGEQWRRDSFREVDQTDENEGKE